MEHTSIVRWVAYISDATVWSRRAIRPRGFGMPRPARQEQRRFSMTGTVWESVQSGQPSRATASDDATARLGRGKSGCQSGSRHHESGIVAEFSPDGKRPDTNDQRQVVALGWQTDARPVKDLTAYRSYCRGAARRSWPFCSHRCPGQLPSVGESAQGE